MHATPQVAYWTEQLAGAPDLALPTDFPRSGSPAVCVRSGWLDVALPEATVAGLESVAVRAGATTFMVLLAGVQLLLSALSGADDVVVSGPDLIYVALKPPLVICACCSRTALPTWPSVG